MFIKSFIILFAAHMHFLRTCGGSLFHFSGKEIKHIPWISVWYKHAKTDNSFRLYSMWEHKTSTNSHHYLSPLILQALASSTAVTLGLTSSTSLLRV